MSAQSHVAIAGAGIGGLTAALALARAGARVTLLERAPILEEVGAGLQLAPNATARLRDLGILEAVERYATTPDAVRIFRARDGVQLARAPLGPIAELRWGAPYLVIHRADLQRALVEACARTPSITLRLGVTVTGFADARAGAEIALRGNGEGEGERIMADALIGADGLRSTIRERLGLGAGDAPRYSGQQAWRALVPRADAPEFARALETGLWLGPRAHLVHYPLRGGDVINVVAITQSPMRDEDAADIWSIDGASAAVSREFAKWCAPARALIAAAPQWRRWPLFDRAPTQRWRLGRVALLGDAAHPMLPFLAQGAAQAIEDAAELARAFAEHGGDIEPALADYQAARAHRAAGVVLASRRQGAIYHMLGPLAFARDLVMSRLGPDGMLTRLDWLYATRPPA